MKVILYLTVNIRLNLTQNVIMSLWTVPLFGQLSYMVGCLLTN